MVLNVNFLNIVIEIYLVININCIFKYRFYFLSGRVGKYWYNFLFDEEKYYICIFVCLRSKEFDVVLLNLRNFFFKFRVIDWYY